MALKLGVGGSVEFPALVLHEHWRLRKPAGDQTLLWGMLGSYSTSLDSLIFLEANKSQSANLLPAKKVVLKT